MILITAPGFRGDLTSSRQCGPAAADRGRGPSEAAWHRCTRVAALHRRSPARVFAASLLGLAFGLTGPACTTVAEPGAAARVAETATQLIAWTGAAPAGIVLDATTGDRVALDALRGRPVVVHFFATWCEPCRAELPLLAAFADRRDDLITIAIDVGEVDLRVKRFAAQVGWTRPVLLDRDRAVARAFGVTALPTTIALDATLTPRLVAEGDLDWRDPTVTAPLVALATTTPDGRTPACTDATC